MFAMTNYWPGSMPRLSNVTYSLDDDYFPKTHRLVFNVSPLSMIQINSRYFRATPIMGVIT